MKTTRIIVLMLLVSSINLFAQKKDLKDLYTDFTTAINSALLTKQGSMDVSGFLSYDYYKIQFNESIESIYTTIQIEPAMSYFIIDDISLGLVFSYKYFDMENPSWVPQLNSEQTLLGPIAKMYFGEKRLRPFIFTDYLFMLGDLEGWELDLGAGLLYQISSNFALNIFGKYGIISADLEYSNPDSQQRIFFGIGITNFIL